MSNLAQAPLLGSLLLLLAPSAAGQKLLATSEEAAGVCFSEYEDGTITPRFCLSGWTDPGGLDFHPRTGQLYFANGAGLWTVSYASSSPSVHPVGQVGGSTGFDSVSFTPSGELFGLRTSGQNQFLVRIDTETGGWSGIGIGPPNRFTVLEYSPRERAFIAFQDDGRLYRLRATLEPQNVLYLGMLHHRDTGEVLTGITGATYVGDRLFATRNAVGAHGVPFTSVTVSDPENGLWWRDSRVFWPGGVPMGLSSLAHYTPTDTTFHNGSGSNPTTFLPASDWPRVGETWTTRVGLSGTETHSLVAISLNPGGCLPGGFRPGILLGTELLAAPPYLRPHHNVPGEVHDYEVPLDADLVGQTFCTQGFGLSFGPLQRRARNALVVTVGSN